MKKSQNQVDNMKWALGWIGLALLVGLIALAVWDQVLGPFFSGPPE